VNVVRPLCNSMMGKHHTVTHRMLVGLGIMIFGAFIAHFFSHYEEVWVAVLGDTIGFGLHGIGLVPLIEALFDEV